MSYAIKEKYEKKIEDHKTEILFVDPIYPGMKDISAVYVNIFCELMTRIQATVGCSYILTHHAGRTSVTQFGSEARRSSPYFGSTFIMAHVTGSYFIEKSEDKNGLIFKGDKSSQSNLMSSITTVYDPSTHLSEIDIPKLSANDRFIIYAKQCAHSGYKPTFKDVRGHLQVSASSLRYLFRIHASGILYKVFKIKGEKELRYIFTP